jgi:hypothetical protein
MNLLNEEQAAVEDVGEALHEGGPAEALAALRSYPELRRAGADALDALAGALAAHLAGGGRRRDWAALVALRAEAVALLARRPAAAARLEAAWAAALAAALRGEGTAAAEHVSRLVALGPLATEAVAAEAALAEREDRAARAAAEPGRLRAAAFLCARAGAAALDAGAADALLALVVPPSLGADAHAAGLLAERAFAALADVLQLAPPPAGDEAEAGARAWAFLSRLRAAPAAAADAWWGVWASAALQALDVAQRRGGACALDANAGLRAVVGALCRAESAPALARCCAAAAAPGARPKEAERACLAALEILLLGDACALAAAHCALLAPEACATVPLRVAALATLAALARRARAEGDGDGQEEPAFWAPAALREVLFAAERDPSVRVRRAAVPLLAAGRAADASSARARARAAAARCRDRDAGVRAAALEALGAFSDAELSEALSAHDVVALVHGPDGEGAGVGGVLRRRLAAAGAAPGGWPAALAAMLAAGLADGGDEAADRAGAALRAALPWEAVAAAL